MRKQTLATYLNFYDTFKGIYRHIFWDSKPIRALKSLYAMYKHLPAEAELPDQAVQLIKTIATSSEASHLTASILLLIRDQLQTEQRLGEKNEINPQDIPQTLVITYNHYLFERWLSNSLQVEPKIVAEIIFLLCTPEVKHPTSRNVLSDNGLLSPDESQFNRFMLNNYGKHFLILLINSNEYEIAERLLQQGLNICDYRVLLDHYVTTNRPEPFELLLKYDNMGIQNRTKLFIKALANGHYHRAQKIMRKGIDFDYDVPYLVLCEAFFRSSEHGLNDFTSFEIILAIVKNTKNFDFNYSLNLQAFSYFMEGVKRALQQDKQVEKIQWYVLEILTECMLKHNLAYETPLHLNKGDGEESHSLANFLQGIDELFAKQVKTIEDNRNISRYQRQSASTSTLFKSCKQEDIILKETQGMAERASLCEVRYHHIQLNKL